MCWRQLSVPSSRSPAMPRCAHEFQAVDLDGDGLPDLVGHEENTQVLGRNGAVFTWRNATRR